MEMEGSVLKYETQTNTSSVLVTVPSSLSYGQPIMQSIYPEWPAYNLSNDPNVHPTFIQPMPYTPTQSVYTPTTETQDMTGMRDPGRRGRRGSSKNYNRNVSHSNEMHTGYISDHNQYPLTVPYHHQPMYCLPDPSIPSQQHPGAVQQIFYPQVYHPATIPQPPSHRVE